MTNLNGEEVFLCLDKGAKEAVRCAEEFLEDVPITKDGYIHQRHKNKLSRAGFEAKESFDPERSGSIYITATIPTTEDKAMPDNSIHCWAKTFNSLRPLKKVFSIKNLSLKPLKKRSIFPFAAPSRTGA